jgi:GT2 family glycosyltransferase
MSYINQHSFDWNITSRDIVLYIPNFGRKNFLIPTLKGIHTDLPRDKWVILVVNDGIHEDMSDLKKFNLCYFTFERGENPKERNGCMIRNYILKRLQSRIVATRDPEIFIEGSDYFKKIYDIDNEIFRPGSMIELAEPETPKILSSNQYYKLSELQYRSIHKVTLDNYRAFHAGFAAPTQKLVKIGGYDEDFKNFYGHEDVDLLMRLKQSGILFVIDQSIITYHIWHMRRTKFLQTVRKNGTIYKNKLEKSESIANENRTWGLGL